jgi:hypothetical protein
MAAGAKVAAAVKRALGGTPSAAARFGLEKCLESEPCFVPYDWIKNAHFYEWLHSQNCDVEWGDHVGGVTLWSRDT